MWQGGVWGGRGVGNIWEISCWVRELKSIFWSDKSKCLQSVRRKIILRSTCSIWCISKKIQCSYLLLPKYHAYLRHSSMHVSNGCSMIMHSNRDEICHGKIRQYDCRKSQNSWMHSTNMSHNVIIMHGHYNISFRLYYPKHVYSRSALYNLYHTSYNEILSIELGFTLDYCTPRVKSRVFTGF